MVEEGQALWAQIQAAQSADVEPQEVTESNGGVSLVADPAADEAGPVADAVPEVTQAEYVAALVQIAADLTTENNTLRQIAATALEQAAEVGQLREMLGISEPSPGVSEEFMAETAAAVEQLRGEDAALLADIMALRSELRALTQSRRRWWRR
jgi:hypothetical protein